MRLLLDTHAFLAWNRSGGSALSDLARSLIEEPENEILVSVASAWEIAIKASRGRLVLPGAPARWVPDRIRRHGFVALPILLGDALEAGALPRIHEDPFDRLLIAQARSHDVPIVTRDPMIARYEVETIW